MITDSPEILFFDNRYHFTIQQQAVYRVEIDQHRHARFYRQRIAGEAFYQETLLEMPTVHQRLLYLTLLLKAITDTQH